LWCWGETGRCIHLEVRNDSQFYEDDEPLDTIQRARGRPPDFVTGRL
jgi:hypothetical protein